MSWNKNKEFPMILKEKKWMISKFYNMKNVKMNWVLLNFNMIIALTFLIHSRKRNILMIFRIIPIKNWNRKVKLYCLKTILIKLIQTWAKNIHCQDSVWNQRCLFKESVLYNPIEWPKIAFKIK